MSHVTSVGECSWLKFLKGGNLSVLSAHAFHFRALQRPILILMVNLDVVIWSPQQLVLLIVLRIVMLGSSYILLVIGYVISPCLSFS